MAYQTEQFTDNSGNPLYWVDNTHTGMTFNETDYPVMVYVYNELVKREDKFKESNGTYIPIIVLGAGSGVPDNPDCGKVFLYKETDGFYIDYRHSVTGESTIFKITDDGIDLSMFPTITYNENVVVKGITQVWVQPNLPSSGKPNDAWIDTDDYSRFDNLDIGVSTTLKEDSPEVIFATGTITITLHDATHPNIIKKIYNKGINLITISGTINGKTNMLLYPGESVELITDGTGWRW